MQDEIVSRLANRLGQELVFAEARRAERSPDPDSMDHFFLGLAQFDAGATPGMLEMALASFDRAVAIDPGNADALAYRAWVNIATVLGWNSDDGEQRLLRAEADVTKALRLRPESAIGHFAYGVLLIVTKRGPQGAAECERALAIDRNLAHARAAIGMAMYLSGRNEETEAHVIEALRMSPRDTRAMIWANLAAISKLAAGKEEEATIWLNRSIELNAGFPMTRFLHAAACARLGRLEEARYAASAGLELNPTFTIARLRSMVYSDDAVYLAWRERMCEGMRLAGVPEG